LRGEVAKRGGVDAGTSTTTRDKEIARNPHPPEGLGRDGPDEQRYQLQIRKTVPIQLEQLLGGKWAGITSISFAITLEGEFCQERAKKTWELPPPFPSFGINIPLSDISSSRRDFCEQSLSILA